MAPQKDAVIDDVLAALSDPTRRGVIERLKARSLRAGELGAALGVDAPTMSRHLRTLLRAGLVEEERIAADARVRMFRVRRDAFASLRAWLDQVEAFWNDQLAAFKKHAEIRGGKTRR